MKIEEGTILVATDGCKMDDTGIDALTIGREYKVGYADEVQFNVVDDKGDVHWFDAPTYNDFFYIKEGATSKQSLSVQFKQLQVKTCEVIDKLLDEIELLEERIKALENK